MEENNQNTLYTCLKCPTADSIKNDSVLRTKSSNCMAPKDDWGLPPPPVFFSLLNLLFTIWNFSVFSRSHVRMVTTLETDAIKCAYHFIAKNCFKSPRALNVVGSLLCYRWGPSLIMSIGFWFSLSTVFAFSAWLCIEVKELASAGEAFSKNVRCVILSKGKKWGNCSLLQMSCNTII